MRDVHVVDAVRAPFGEYDGGLAGVRPDEPAAHAIRELLGRTPYLDPSRIDDVYFGNANGAGEENRDVARRGGGTAIATLRTGVGQGLALVLGR